ncbi:MAG: hypothetical protein JXQ87_05450 [Bacteroidia bacterium]
MKRIHFFEFGDKNWVPKFLRDLMTDFLEFGADQFNIYEKATPIFKKGIEKASENRIIDMGSGGGGGWPKIISNLQESSANFKVKLTDINPNIGAFKKMQELHPDVIEFEKEPVDASKVPSQLKGFRTMFLSFHHLKPNLAKAVLQNAVDSQEPIGIFELQDRTPLSLFFMFLAAPINAILTAPFIKPFKLTRIFFTFLIPILPLMIWFDGVVSNLRTYSEKELEALTKELNMGDSYHWEIAKIKNGPGFILYLLGYKK